MWAQASQQQRATEEQHEGEIFSVGRVRVDSADSAQSLDGNSSHCVGSPDLSIVNGAILVAKQMPEKIEDKQVHLTSCSSQS